MGIELPLQSVPAGKEVFSLVSAGLGVADPIQVRGWLLPELDA
jgi:hypothetical protein